MTPPEHVSQPPSLRPAADRTPHRVWCPDLLSIAQAATPDTNRPNTQAATQPDSPAEPNGGPIRVIGAEAHHAARVRRLRVGDPVELFDGAGHTQLALLSAIRGSKANPVLELAAAGPSGNHEPDRLSPIVCSPIPKGDRLGTMIEQLSQVGAASWVPLIAARAQGDRAGFKREKLERIAVESAKQCRRAWLLTIPEAEESFAHAITQPNTVLLDGSGESAPLRALAADLQSADAEPWRLMIGPEGGWAEAELAQARAARVRIVRLPTPVLRLETAAVAAVCWARCTR